MGAGEFSLMRAAMVMRSVRDETVQALIGGRFYDDTPPDGVAFPYVTMGRSERHPKGPIFTTLHVWSRTGGRSQALDVIAALRNALAGKPVTLGREGEGELAAQFSDVFRSGDGRTTHGILRVFVSPQEASGLGSTQEKT